MLGENFNELIRKELRFFTNIHWSEIPTIQLTTDFFKKNDAKNVLDIGSGIGKFCIISALNSNIHFTGIEIREVLHNEALRISKIYNLKNITFIQADVKEIDFSPFDAFYYYNPFCEHIAVENWIEKNDFLAEEKYYEYEEIVLNKLEKMKEGTLVVLHYAKTFFLSENFQLIDIKQNGELTFWKKIK